MAAPRECARRPGHLDVLIRAQAQEFTGELTAAIASAGGPADTGEVSEDDVPGD
jgi:hypothetical protein